MQRCGGLWRCAAHRANAVRADARKFGVDQKYLRRVINPHQHERLLHKGPGLLDRWHECKRGLDINRIVFTRFQLRHSNSRVLVV